MDSNNREQRDAEGSFIPYSLTKDITPSFIKRSVSRDAEKSNENAKERYQRRGTSKRGAGSETQARQEQASPSSNDAADNLARDAGGDQVRRNYECQPNQQGEL